MNENIAVIGIDLGTTNSCVGTWKNGKIEIIPNDSGGRTLPSVVSFKKYEIIVGKAAKNLIIENSKNTIYDSKRIIGRRFQDKSVQEDIKNWDFKVEEDIESEKPEYIVDFNNKKIKLYPEEISALILKKIKSISSDYIGSNPEKAVITVPAHFTNSQRESTKKAAEIAGLKVIRIINEPTATAIGYLYDIQNDLERCMKKNKEMNEFEKERIILVFDLGGGTFDVSIVKFENKNFEILASCGDDHLGGEDLTERLTDYVIECFKSDENIDENINFKDKNNRDLFKSYLKLKNKIEDYKTQLSFQNAVDIVYEDNFYNNKSISMNLLRSNYEEVCQDLFERCLDKIKEVIKEAKIEKEDINDIVLSGGASITPKIQENIEEYLKKKIKKTIEPNEAIAYGATLVACIESDFTTNDNELKKMKDIKIIDVTPFSIGIETAGGKMEFLIPKGTKLPEPGKTELFRKNFTPQKDYAKSYTVQIYEGENEDVEDNYKLGMFKVLIENRDIREKIIVKILIKLDHHSIFTISASTNDLKKAEIISSEIYRKEIEERFNEHLKEYENAENESKKFQNCKIQYNEEMKKIKEYVKNNNIKDKEITKKIKEFEGWERKAERGINDYIQKKEEIKQFLETLKK